MTITTEEAEAVERYRPAVHNDGCACMVDCMLGAWVSWYDYQSLAAERDQMRARAERAEALCEQWRKAAQDQELKHMAASVGIDSLTERLEKAEKARDDAEAERLRDGITAAIIAYEHDIAQGVEPSEDRRRVIAVLRAALEGGDDER